MSMWSNFKKWALRGSPLAEPYIEPCVPRYDEMVGEPVISFIESLHRERARRYVISDLDVSQYRGEKHYWMSQRNFYQLLDKKTGTIYQGYIHDNRLYAVVGLPFDLSGWEYTALFDAFLGYRVDARNRLNKMKHKRWLRNRDIAKAEELANRAAFAKQFQEQ